MLTHREDFVCFRLALALTLVVEGNEYLSGVNRLRGCSPNGDNGEVPVILRRVSATDAEYGLTYECQRSEQVEPSLTKRRRESDQDERPHHARLLSHCG